MSYNQNGVSPSYQPHALQLLGSDPQQKHLLQYCADENEWNEFLVGSGLHNPSNPSKPTSGAPAIFKATASGPNPFTSNQNDASSQKYAIVSIMGPQSSGKSTILNRLFGTNFDVMDHTRGRHQVTTGIWIGSCPRARELMVLDLEGTDSAERKQNRSNFERQTSLMALTLSEVLVINMWASDIGRSTGMNVDTLRAILEANLRLFAPNTKTLLLFLIREQSPDETQFGVTPALQLQQTIQHVVMSIWNDIDKPDAFNTTKIEDLFDIDFYFMPPLVYFRKEFDEKVNDLYARFTDPSHRKYYFNTRYHLSKCVPPEGLPTWTKQIFEAITSDESLNIPDQQKLLSAYRCEHALNESYTMFKQSIQSIVNNVQEKYIDAFGSTLDTIINDVIAKYKETASKYDAEEANEKYESLVDKIETQIQYLFSFQFKHLLEQVQELYLHEMNQRILSNGGCVDDLSEMVERIGDSTRKFFSHKIEECMITTDSKALIDREVYWKETQKRLREVTKTIQAEQWQLLCKENEYLSEEHLLNPITSLLRTPTQKIWHQVSTLRIEYHGKILNEIIVKKLNNLMYDEFKLAEKQRSIRDASDASIINRCKKYCQRMDGVLQDRFDQLFNKDPDTAIPRRWDESVKLDEIFCFAKTQCLEILTLTQDIVLQQNHDLGLQEIKLKLLSSDIMDDIRTQFLRFADNEYRRAQDNVRRSTMIGGGILPTHPITWMVFLFFAKDELWTMLTNPLYLILFVFGALILTIVYQAHVYGFDVRTIVSQMVNRIVDLIMSKLQDFQRAQANIQQRGQQRANRIKERPLISTNPTDDTLQ